METLIEAIPEELRYLDRQCEGAAHVASLKGHWRDAPAAWRCGCPNCDFYVLFCHPRVSWARQYERGWVCLGCQKPSFLSDWSFLPLAGNS